MKDKFILICRSITVLALPTSDLCPDLRQDLIPGGQFPSVCSALPPHFCVSLLLISSVLYSNGCSSKRPSQIIQCKGYPSHPHQWFSIMSLYLDPWHDCKHLVYLPIIYLLTPKWTLHHCLVPLGCPQYLAGSLPHRSLSTNIFEWLNPHLNLPSGKLKCYFILYSLFSFFLDSSCILSSLYYFIWAMTRPRL